jgi:arginine decarboxylase
MNHGIIDAICRYASRRPVRMHMPGHKGKKAFAANPIYIEPTPEWATRLLDDLRILDMTESPGLDNLHYPVGCIRETEARAECLFGSSRSYLLVNGATSGIQASLIASRMILGAGNVVLPRNVHRSMVTAMAMSGLDPVFVWPEYNSRLGGYLPLDTDRVKEVLSSTEPPRAILILNPTYSGFARDLSEIADLAHSQGALLIVDEAHGTHYKVGKDLPPSALDMGADIVVHGAHKTTVAFTQTAFLHIGKSTPERFPYLKPAIEESLRAVQTTSPSYILMASLEQALDSLEENEGAWVNRGVETARELARRLSQIPGISVVGHETSIPIPSGLMQDPGRVLVNLSGLSVSGPEAARFLVSEKRVDPEMIGPDYLLLIWTGADGEQDITVVEDAFRNLAQRYPGNLDEKPHEFVMSEAPRPKKVLSLREAFLSVARPIQIEDAVGRISADTVVIYPPGSPIITPGEVFSRQIVDYILSARKTGLNVLGRGIVGGSLDTKVYCVHQ